MILQFDPFELDTARAELRCAGRVVPVEPKVFALLCLLVENRDRVVDRDEMIAVVWDGRFISEAAVATALKQVRKALGDDGDAQTFVRTVRGRGHRFVAPVRIASAAAVGPAPAAGPAGGRPTIAVLPFRGTGSARVLDMLADAIPAEIISSLSRLRWPRVIARASAFRFRGAPLDPAALRSVLGAGYALAGEVGLDGRRLSVGVDLIDTLGGVLLWAERFERALDDVHLVRAEIVEAVTAALDLRVPLAEAARARQTPAEDLDAWGAYHLGVGHMYRFNARDNALAEALFRRATDLDPGFASAWAARSFTSFQNVMMGYRSDWRAARDEAWIEAETAQGLDPLDPYANAALGRVQILTGAPADGLPWLDRALELSPSYAKGHYSRAYLQVLLGDTGRTRAGIDLAMTLSPLDPLLPPMRLMQAFSFGIDGDHAAAADCAVQAARTARTHLSGMMLAAAFSQMADRPADALHWAAEARQRRPDATIGLFLRSLPFAASEFMAALTQALRQTGFPD